MFGFYNMVLRINLSQESFELKMISDQVLCMTLGGKGLAAHLFREFRPDQAGPSPHDSLIFATGPVTGNMVPGSLCCGAFTRSPQAGYSADYFNGSIAAYMAGTGFDAVVVNGSSDRPVWIEVCEGGSFFHPGAELPGSDAMGLTKRIESWMKANRPAARRFGIVCIGDDGVKRPDLLTPKVESWPIGRRSHMARLLLAEKVIGVVFWGAKKRVLANPELIRRFASGERTNPGTGDPLASSGADKSEPSSGFETGGAEAEYRSLIQDCLIIRDSIAHYEWEDLGALIEGATGLDLGKEALRAIARSVTEDIEHLT